MAQLLESRREFTDLGRRDDLVRTDLLHANAEILALRRELSSERTCCSRMVERITHYSQYKHSNTNTHSQRIQERIVRIWNILHGNTCFNGMKLSNPCPEQTD